MIRRKERCREERKTYEEGEKQKRTAIKRKIEKRERRRKREQ